MYICEDGLVHYCSQQRGYPAKPLEQYTTQDVRREYLTDDPTFGFPLLNPFSVLSDREEGKLWPIYQSEQDLARIRGRDR